MNARPELTIAAPRTVLAVDDDMSVLEGMRRELLREGFEVTAVTSAEEALELARVNDYSLVISDNIMPGMRGLEFLSIVMNMLPGARRILVTGYTDHDHAIEAFNQGILHRYLQKPWDRTKLQALLREEWEAYHGARKELMAIRDLESALTRRTSLVEEAVNLLKRAESELNEPAGRQHVERKLAAILHGDVVGFSRLMGDDHEATLHTLTEYREALTGIIRANRGRLVNAVGDSVLAEFPSAVDSLRCAVDAQRDFCKRNAALPEHRRMLFRFGVNIGDVLVREGDLYGDGVNVAARLQALAPAGGVCVSESVLQQVRHRLPYEYEAMGGLELKNIQDVVSAYRVKFD